MSYRDELKEFSSQRLSFKKIFIRVIIVTAAVLTVAMLGTAVTVSMEVVNMLDGGGSSDIGDGGSSSGSKKPEIVLANGGDTIYLVVNDGDGDTVSWRNLVKATGGASLQFDNSGVNITKEGKYVLKCTATSSTGKTAKRDITVIVTKAEHSYDTLMNTVVKSKVMELGITDSMSTAEKVKKIYEFVNSPGKTKSEATIYFNDKSLTKSIDRDDWEFGWVTEAYLAFEQISKNGKTSSGDCYTYYSVSKAFFEYFGIEHVGIKRDESLDAQYGTHFWLMVNLGTKNSPKWYYYDATRLAGKFGETGTNNGCLLTLAELQSYKTSDGKDYFYTFDPGKYPKATTQSVQK